MRAPSAERLLEVLGQVPGQTVPMLVDLVADRFITGTPKRISREAPVLILRYEGETLVPGGGANTVANVAALGGRPVPLGVVGDDAAGHELLSILESRGVSTRGVLRRAGYRTPTKTRILGGARHQMKQQIVRFDIEDRVSLTAGEKAELLEVAGAVEARVAVVSDYGYGAVEPDLLPELRRILGPGTSVLGDSRYRLAELPGLDGATPNSEEAEALLGRPLEDGLEEGGRELLERLGTRFLLVTRGSAGMSLFTGEGSFHIPVHGTDQVADVTGAGDTVIGTFALALAAGASPLEAACLANYAGGLVVMKMGTATIGLEELSAAVEQDPGILEKVSSAPR